MSGWAATLLEQHERASAAARASGEQHALKEAAAWADAAMDALAVFAARSEGKPPAPLRAELGVACAFSAGASVEVHRGTARTASTGGLVVEGLPPFARGTTGRLHLLLDPPIALVGDVVAQSAEATAFALSVMSDEHRLAYFELLLDRLATRERLPQLAARILSPPAVRQKPVAVRLGPGAMGEALPILLHLRGFEVTADLQSAAIVVGEASEVAGLHRQRPRGTALVLVHGQHGDWEETPPDTWLLEGTALPSRAAELVSAVADLSASGD